MGDDEVQVTVVGGGIGGMAAAAALLRRGIDVHVYEQAPELGEVGAGVMITPNGLRLLHRLGLGEAVATLAAPITDRSQYFRQDGTLVAPLLTVDSSGWNGMCGMHRADLLDALAGVVPSERVHTGHRCSDFSQDERSATVVFDNGVTVRSDAVVAADGIHSSLQRFVVPPAPPRDSGSVAYRGLVAAERVPWWPEEVSQLWMGDSRHFLAYSVRGGQLINYVGFVPAHEKTEESWFAVGNPDTLRAEFASWDSPITRLLAEVSECNWWGLYDRDPLPLWTRGRLTLLGDAAHPMLPHLGQGANQSIEDAVALSVFLGDAKSETVPAALRAYDALRRHRTSEVQLGARANGRRFNSEFTDLAARDAELAKSVAFRFSLYDYDAEAAAIEALGVD